MAGSLASQIETAAATAASVSVDGQTVNERSLSELIEADKYLGAVNARDDATLGLRFANFDAPGPLGGHRS